MKTIWKFSLATGVALSLPVNAQVLSVQEQHGVPTMWVMVDQQGETEFREFITVPTGGVVPEGKLRHLGTAVMDGGAFVLHAFEKLK